VLDLEHILGAALDVFGDLMAVSRSNEKRPEDEQVEGAPKEFDFVATLIHGRHSTLDGRLSTIEKKTFCWR